MKRLSKYRIVLLLANLLVVGMAAYFIAYEEKEKVVATYEPFEIIPSIFESDTTSVNEELPMTPLEEEELKWQQFMEQYSEKIVTNDSLYDLAYVASSTLNTNTITWYGYTIENWRIYFSDSAQEKYIYLMDAIPNIHQELEAYFGFPLQLDVPVYIVDQFDDPNLMYKGYYVNEKNYVLLNVRSQREYDIRPLYAHEMAHLYQLQQWNMERLHAAFGIGHRIWLTEGMAEYISTQKVTYPTILTPIGVTLPHQLGYQQYKDRLDDVPKQDILNMKSWPTFWYENNYIIFESLIYYLETKYGHDAFMNWVQRVSDGVPLHQATKEVFFITDEEIIADWKTFFDLE